jgi:glycosyltransferase involved in cell wall biosynthesis
MRITAAVIMRNEAVLIASKLALCASWADEIVVIDQRSEDESVFIAREALRLLAIEHAIEPMRGDVLGKALSYPQAFDLATGDWVVYTDVDEILVARGLAAALARVPAECCAPGVRRWHGIVNRDDYFKVEELDHKRFRFLRKPGARVLRLDTDRYVAHQSEPVESASEHPRYDLPVEDAFLMEFKAPYQHYADQLFYDAIGSRNERRRCEQEFAASDLRIGRMLFEAAHAQNAPRRHWWQRRARGRGQADASRAAAPPSHTR